MSPISLYELLPWLLFGLATFDLGSLKKFGHNNVNTWVAKRKKACVQGKKSLKKFGHNNVNAFLNKVGQTCAM